MAANINYEIHMRYYNKVKNCLIWIDSKATSEYWASQWESAGISRSIYKPSSYVSRITKKYVDPSDGLILEAGCGRANHVYALTNQGYHVTGVDFAAETIDEVKKIMPELDVRAGDVLQLPFDDASFVGYWSLGLIEHFWDGYDQLVKESYRVLKPGGYAFYTFPYMSPVRQFKASLNQYTPWSATEAEEPADFYQFSLSKHAVRQSMEQAGFAFVSSRGLDGIKGLKSEVKALAPVLQKLYDYRGQSVPLRGARFLLSETLSLFSGHSVLLVLQKPK